MHTNMGSFDRALRAGIAVIALVAALVIGAGSVAGVVLLVLTALAGVTAAVGFCPLYALFHVDSHGRRPLAH